MSKPNAFQPCEKNDLTPNGFNQALIIEINKPKLDAHRMGTLLLQSRNHLTTDTRMGLIKLTIDKRSLGVLMLFDHHTVTAPEVLTYALQQKAWVPFRYCFHQSRRNDPSIETILTTLNGNDEDTYQLTKTLLDKPVLRFSPLIVALTASLSPDSNETNAIFSAIRQKTNQRMLHPEIIRELEGVAACSCMPRQ